MRIFYAHTQAPNGGYGILGKGIYKALKLRPDVELISDEKCAFPGIDFRSLKTIPQVDIIFTYGMPDLVEYATRLAQYQERYYGKKPVYYHYAVWESSMVPDYFIDAYKRVDHLITASKYTKRAFTFGGIKHVDVWHHAIDDRFQYIEKSGTLTDAGTKKPFTFLHHNAFEYRKGWELVLEAFSEEFHIEENVKLILKGREYKSAVWLFPEKRLTQTEYELKQSNYKAYLDKLFQFDHPLIEKVMGHVSDEEMVRINSEADVFVFPAKGEGWGLPPFEAAAMGIVPIIPNKSSFTEWFNKDCMLEVGIEGYLNSAPRYPGYMYQCSKKSLRRKMRWAFEHQDKIKEMGKKASKYVHENYNWSKIINDLIEIFNKYE